jgi:SHS2 domain-containing protein
MQQHEPAAAHWAHFQHVADVGVRGFGASLAEAFEQAALALTAVVTEPDSVRPDDPVDFSCAAPDPEILLVDWLNDLVYEMATRSMLFSRFEVHVTAANGGFRLTARAWGEPVDVARHQPAAEVKGATLSELEVGQAPDGCWQAQCIVDV